MRSLGARIAPPRSGAAQQRSAPYARPMTAAYPSSCPITPRRPPSTVPTTRTRGAAMGAPSAQIDYQVRAISDLVGNMSPDQLDNDTPCAGWKVRDLMGHLVGGGQT